MTHLYWFWRTPLRIGPLSFAFTPLEALLRLLLPLLALAAVYVVVLLVLRRLLRRGKPAGRARRDKIYRRLRLALRLLILLCLALTTLSFFGVRIGEVLYRGWELLSTPFVTAGSSRISVITVLLAIPVFYLASWFSRWSRWFLERRLLDQVAVNEATRFTIVSLVRYGVLVLAIVIGLSIIGVNLSALTVVFGVLGIGLGFGLQNVVANYVAGIVIFLERPVKEGDRILVNGLEGDVVQIRLRSTVINTLTNETIIVPNSQLVGNTVHNYSYQDKRIVTVNEVQVSYATDLDRAREVLLEVAARNPYGLSEPAPEVRVLAFQDSGILLALWTWIGAATQKLAALSWTNLEIWRAFKREGVAIPFPQVDLHVPEPVLHRPLPPGER